MENDFKQMSQNRFPFSIFTSFKKNIVLTVHIIYNLPVHIKALSSFSKTIF